METYVVYISAWTPTGDNSEIIYVGDNKPFAYEQARSYASGEHETQVQTWMNGQMLECDVLEVDQDDNEDDF